MKPLIVYQSRTGNTRVVAEAMASALNADAVSVDRVTADEFKDRSLVGFGSGIYQLRVDPKIYESLSLLPGNCKVFMFITSGSGFRPLVRLYWHLIKKSLDRLGISLAGSWHCRGYDQYPPVKWMGLSKGHPDAADIESARQFALKMKLHE